MNAALQFDDEGSRRLIRESLDESLLVEAAAGTGKTSELVQRIVALLGRGKTEVDQIVAVTFTRKAAGELKLRLRKELDRARQNAAPDVKARLEAAVEHLEEARIGTIHSFCADILRERPVEAVVDPAFEELSDPEARRLYRQAFRTWMEERLDCDSPALRRAFSRLLDSESPVTQLANAGWRLMEWRDFPCAWSRPAFDRNSEIDALVHQVQHLKGTGLMVIDRLASAIARSEAVRVRDHDALEGQLAQLWKDLRDKRKKQVEPLKLALAQFKLRADADLAALLQAELLELADRYDAMKRRAGKLDFIDLLVRTRDLIRDRPDIRGYFQQRYSHVFVDEFQDTDPLQAEILLLLAADDPAQNNWREAHPKPGKLFVVGDPKQSIYRFRRADVQLYREVSSALLGAGVRILHLTKSYRAVRPIQQTINAAFGACMTGDDETGQPNYVPLDEYSPAPADQPCVIALPVPQPYGKRDVAKYAIEKCLPDTVAAFVDWLVRESRWTVRDPAEADARVPLSPRHIAILFRKFADFEDGRRQDATREYVRSLEARGIAHLLLGGKSFHRREEVETVRAALNAVEWPDDELSVFAALKGPLFAIPDDVLLRYRAAAGSLHPFRPAAENVDDDCSSVATALVILATLHRRRNHRPVVATVNELLEVTRAHAGFALRPGGGQVLANVYRVADLARSFEMSGGISFRGFIDELADEAEREESAEAPVLEEGAEGVRIMTVHAAKGLEFPVVILAGIGANLARWRPERYIDVGRRLCAIELLGCAPQELLDNMDMESRRDEAEGIRVAYVAATRARDLLVVPAVGDQPLGGGWTEPLNDAIYPWPDRRRRSSAAFGCPDFGEDTVLERPPEVVTRPADSVRPGLHQLAGDVVWWDPSRLLLGVRQDFGVSQDELLSSGGHADESLRQYQEWRTQRAVAIADGVRPRFALFTASGTLDPPPGRSPVIEVAAVDRDAQRPVGPRFGSLVHEVLRDVPLADTADIPAIVAMHARRFGATPAEKDAAEIAVRRAIDHSLLIRARSASRCCREMPVHLDLDGGRIFEGVVDLAFLENDQWVVVDFKTDAELPVDRYRRQLEWYVYALSTITGQPASGWLLSV